MRTIKRFIPLVVSIAVVVAVAFIGLLQSAQANARAQQIRRDDRVSEQKDLAGLTNQYVMFALKDAFDFASITPLSLKPGDPADTAAIKAFVKRSALLNYGGALVGLNGTPINAYDAGHGLPLASDPGYVPLRTELLAGKPGVSTVYVIESGTGDVAVFDANNIQVWSWGTGTGQPVPAPAPPTPPQNSNCVVSLSPTYAGFGSAGGSSTLTVTAPGNCSWSLGIGAPWLSAGATSGVGTMSFSFTVTPNSTGIERASAFSVDAFALSIDQGQTPGFTNCSAAVHTDGSAADAEPS